MDEEKEKMFKKKLKNEKMVIERYYIFTEIHGWFEKK
jgi:hypothetical protein